MLCMGSTTAPACHASHSGGFLARHLGTGQAARPYSGLRESEQEGICMLTAQSRMVALLWTVSMNAGANDNRTNTSCNST